MLATIFNSPSDHGKALIGTKVGRPRSDCDRFLARVDQVWVLLPGFREGSQAQHTVLTLELNVHSCDQI